ncbi:hypothetical protein B0H16DRAFT_1214444, partial [Mycena metata]
VVFDPNITVTSIANCFRVFVNNPRSKHAADQMPQELGDPSVPTVYVAGAYKVSDSGDPCAGGGVWVSPGHRKNNPIGVPADLRTRTSGELTAILHVIQSTPQNSALKFIVNSKATVSKLTLNVHRLEANGWIGEKDRTLLTTIIAALRVRGTRT